MTYHRGGVYGHLLLRSLVNSGMPTHAREVVSKTAKRYGLSVNDLKPCGRKRTHPYAPVVIEAIRDCRAAKFGPQAIGDALGRPCSTICDWMRKHEIA